MSEKFPQKLFEMMLYYTVTQEFILGRDDTVMHISIPDIFLALY